MTNRTEESTTKRSPQKKPKSSAVQEELTVEVQPREVKGGQHPKRVRSNVEFHESAVYAAMARALLEQKNAFESTGRLTGVQRDALHLGLEIMAALLGPRNGLYAGVFDGSTLAQHLRQTTLGLVDFAAQQGVPILPIVAYSYPPPPSSKGPSSTSIETAEINKQGAATLKGIGGGLVKRQRADTGDKQSGDTSV